MPGMGCREASRGGDADPNDVPGQRSSGSLDVVSNLAGMEGGDTKRRRVLRDEIDCLDDYTPGAATSSGNCFGSAHYLAGLGLETGFDPGTPSTSSLPMASSRPPGS